MDYLWLVFAHCLGDMPLQTQFLSNNKGKFLYAMFAHGVIWTGCVCVALMLIAGEVLAWEVIFLFIGHTAMDRWKSVQPRDEAHRWQIYVDQGWHYLQLLIVYLF